MKILDVDFHRNGVAGEGFDVVQFEDQDRRMIGVLFEYEGQCAVLDVDALSLAWRGDMYEPELRAAIAHADDTGERFSHTVQ